MIGRRPAEGQGFISPIAGPHRQNVVGVDVNTARKPGEVQLVIMNCCDTGQTAGIRC